MATYFLETHATDRAIAKTHPTLSRYTQSLASARVQCAGALVPSSLRHGKVHKEDVFEVVFVQTLHGPVRLTERL